LRSQTTGTAAAIGIGTILVIAGICIGGFLGFLFSLPRVLSDPGSAGLQGEPSPEKSARRSRLLASNTNLEQISDKLTTMLTGVALSQLAFIRSYFDGLNRFISANIILFPGAAKQAGSLPVIAPFLVVVGLFVGFIFFYLYTRISLTPIFLEVEAKLSPGEEELTRGGQEVVGFAQRLVTKTRDPKMAQVAQSAAVSVEQSLYVIQGLLYDGGYEEAIDLGTTLAGTSAADLARYWYLMAAAFGQRYSHVRGEDSETSAETRNSVLNAAREAVKRDIRYKPMLRSLTDASSFDNDLKNFADDPEFLEIIQ
jgi:hypothetical protein